MRSRAAIIQAVLELVEREGFRAVNVSAVASAAGVTRQTVYSIFGTREELVSQAVATVATEALAEMTAHLDGIDDAGEYLVELGVAGRATTRRHPVLRALLQAELGNPLFDAGMMERARPVVGGLLAPLRTRDPRLADAATFDGLVELFTRIGISIVVFDSDATRTDDDLRAFLRRWVAPVLL